MPSGGVVGKSTQYYSWFDLKQIPALALWLDGQDTTTIDISGGTTGGYLQRWRDKSGRGYTATPISNKVFYEPGSARIGMLGNDAMAITPTLSSGNVVETGFVVCSIDVGIMYILSGYPALGAPYRRFVTTSGGFLQTPGPQVVLTSSVNPFVEGRLAVACYVNNGQTVTHYMNGLASGSAASSGFTQGNGTSIGGDGTSGPFRGSIAEVLIFQTALTDGQRQAVENYLFTKWKLPYVPTFTPLSIPGCKLWLDGADSSTVSSRQWNDKSGLGYHAAVTTASNITIVNGAPFFSNTSAVAPTPPPTTAETLFISVKSICGSIQYPIGSEISTNTDRRIRFNAGRYILYMGAYPVNNGVTLAPDRFGQAVYDYVLNDGNSNLITSTNRQFGWAQASVTFSGGGGTTIGSANNASTPFWGNVNEVVLYSNNLTASDRDRVRSYLMGKWGCADLSATPATNPYSDPKFPPLVRPATMPIDIAGCYMWYDAGDSNAMTRSGSNVTTLFDKSGNNNHISNAVTVSGPTYSNNAITFNGTTQFLSNTTLSIPFRTHSLIAVHRPLVIDASNNGNTSLIRFQSASTTYTAFPYMFGTTRVGYINSTNTVALLSNSTLVENSATTEFDIIMANASGCNIQIYNNGVLQSSTTNPTSSAANVSNFSMGKHNQSNKEFYQGTIQEVIVFTKALSDAERQSVEGYLATKWGLLSSLPADHPVKSQIQYIPPFSPLNLQGLSLWLDGADTSSMTFSGSNISRWNDKSGLGRHAIAVGAGPTYNTAARSPIFTGGQNLRGVANFLHNSTDGTWSVYVVATTTNTSTITNLINYDVTPNRISQFLRVEPNGTLGTIGFATTGTTPFSGTTASAITANNRFLFGGVNTTSNLTAYLSGTPGTPGTHTANITVSNVNYTVGVYEQLNGQPYIGGYWSGQISEILVFAKASSTAERQRIEGYLAGKWGLQSTLPSNHPYKKFTP